ncbi:MAG: dephospho-CoA kinase [Lachnospiraceae bacterium]|nr:dephospho-CoA kinase [Lachnospiraceae bacterium]
MKIIGITGGVGCGKSRVLHYLCEVEQAEVRQLDRVARELQKKDAPCYVKIVKRFGSAIVLADGTLNRQKLAEMIFQDESKRRWMNNMMHPAVRQWILEDIQKSREAGKSFYIIEAALLIEAKYDMICDELWYIYATQEVRRDRLRETRGYSEEKINQMMESQLPETAFRQNTDVCIDNNGDFAWTTKQLLKNMERLKGK